MKRTIAVFLSVPLLIALSGCEKDEAEPFQLPDNLQLDSIYSVVDGKLINLCLIPQGKGAEEKAAEIDNAVCVMANRFVLCSDGTIVDLYGSWIDQLLDLGQRINDSLATDVTLSLVTELYTTCGIHDIKHTERFDNSLRLYAGDGYFYEFYLPALSYTKVEDPHIGSDGSVFSEKYPELSSWTDVVELRMGYDYQNSQDVFIGLTSSGKVLSYGIDFTPENIVKIQIYNAATDIVVGALTANGRLVFSEVPEPEDETSVGYTYALSLYNAVQQAREYTDVEDFIISEDDNRDIVILVKKKDGTFHATTNNYYNPKLVESP